MRKRYVIPIALICTAVFAGSAIAGIYLPNQYCVAGTNGSSSYSSSWHSNTFYTEYSGPDKTVTLIDNVSYGWHATVRNTNQSTFTSWNVSNVKKAYCLDNGGPAAYGACSTYS